MKRRVGSTVSFHLFKFHPGSFLCWWLWVHERKGGNTFLHKPSGQSGFVNSGKCEVLPYSVWGRPNPHLYPKRILSSLGSCLFWSSWVVVWTREWIMEQRQTAEGGIWLQSSSGGISLWLLGPSIPCVYVSYQESFIGQTLELEF